MQSKSDIKNVKQGMRKRNVCEKKDKCETFQSI